MLFPSLCKRWNLCDKHLFTIIRVKLRFLLKVSTRLVKCIPLLASGGTWTHTVQSDSEIKCYGCHFLSPLGYFVSHFIWNPLTLPQSAPIVLLPFREVPTACLGLLGLQGRSEQLCCNLAGLSSVAGWACLHPADKLVAGSLPGQESSVHNVKTVDYEIIALNDDHLMLWFHVLGG